MWMWWGWRRGGDPWKILLDNIASEVDVSTLADVPKDKNETEEFLSAVSSDEADDIAKHEDGHPELVRKGTPEIDWTLLNYIFDNSVHLDIKRIKYGCE